MLFKTFGFPIKFENLREKLKPRNCGLIDESEQQQRLGVLSNDNGVALMQQPHVLSRFCKAEVQVKEKKGGCDFYVC